MSVEWVARVFSSSLVRGSGRLVLLALAERANNDGVCWPSVADIARRAGLSVSRTKAVLSRLRLLAEVVASGGGRGPEDTCVYGIVGDRNAVEVLGIVERLAEKRSADRLANKKVREGTGRSTLSDESNEGRKGTGVSVARVLPDADKGTTASAARVLPAGYEPPVEPPVRTVMETSAGGASLGHIAAGAAAASPHKYDLALILSALKISPETWRNAPLPIRRTLILDGLGCDGSFRQYLNRMNLDLRVLQELADAYCRSNGRIKNAGGWLRDQLRKRGLLNENGSSRTLRGQTNRLLKGLTRVNI